MLGKSIEEYQNISRKTRFISQLAAFLIAIFSAFSLYDLAGFFKKYPEELNSFIENTGLLSSVAFQASISIVFAAKFVLLIFNTKKVFWLNQLLSVVGLALFVSFWWWSKPADTGFGIYSTNVEYFRHASRGFHLGLYYLFLSPLYHLFTVVVALFKSK
jgi:hypothetical protein